MMTARAAAHDKALAELHKLLKVDAKDARALLRLAELHVKEGSAQSLTLGCEVYSRAGDVFVEQGFARRALSSFAQALQVARRGGLVDRIGRIARAMSKLYVSEKLPREAWAVLDTSARFLIEKGEDHGAARLLEDRIALDDSEMARVRLAEAYFRMKEPEKASAQLMLVFGRFQVEGRRDEALDVAERLLGERRDVAMARTAAQMYLGRNRPGDAFLALEKLRICCLEDPTHVPTLELLAQAFVQAGHMEKAARVWREIRSGGSANKDLPKLAPSSPKLDSGAMAAAEVDAAWDEIPITEEEPLDTSRASFWPVDEGPGPDESGSVVSVSLADVELIDADIVETVAPQSDVRALSASVFETALEHLEALVAQGRWEEARVHVSRQLALHPRNPLLLERKAEIEDMQTAQREGPPPALFGFVRKADSQRKVQTLARKTAS